MRDRWYRHHVDRGDAQPLQPLSRVWYLQGELDVEPGLLASLLEDEEDIVSVNGFVCADAVITLMRIGVPALRAQLAGKPHSSQRTALEAKSVGLEESMSDCSLGLRAMCDDLIRGRVDASPMLAELLQLPVIGAFSQGGDYKDAGELCASCYLLSGSAVRVIHSWKWKATGDAAGLHSIDRFFGGADALQNVSLLLRHGLTTNRQGMHAVLRLMGTPSRPCWSDLPFE